MNIQQWLWGLPCLWLIGCTEADPTASFLNATSMQVIQANYNQLADRARALSVSANQCSTGLYSDTRLQQELQAEWLTTMSIWQQAQWVQFGPIKEGWHEWQMQFWPDKKNLVGKKVKSLAVSDAPINDASIESAGVLAQGLSAMEVVLFDDVLMKKTTPEKQCLLVKTIAKRIQQTSDELNTGWTQYHQNNFLILGQPTTDSELLDQEQALAAIIGNLATFLDKVTEKKLGGPFGLEKDATRTNAYFLESWRSQTSQQHILDNLKVLQSIMTTGRLSALLESKGHPVLAQQLSEQTQKAIYLITQSHNKDSYYLQLTRQNTSAIEEAKQLFEQLNQIRRLVYGDLVTALNVQLGFNGNDGDS